MLLTDREQDQLAASAAGIEINHYRGDVAMIKRVNSRGQEDLVAWRPKVDDGDALRLAVGLGLDIKHGKLQQEVYVYGRTVVAEKYAGNPCAATRLAIWKAAIGMGGKCDGQ